MSNAIRKNASARSILAGAGSLLVFLSVLIDLTFDVPYIRLEQSGDTDALPSVSLDQIGELFAQEPILAVAFVVGITVTLVGTTASLSGSTQGAGLSTLGFALVTLPIVVAPITDWTARPATWAAFLLPGVVLANMSVTFRRDAAKLPVLAVVGALVLGFGTGSLVIAYSVLPVDDVGILLGVTVLTVGAFAASIRTVDGIDSGVTAAAVIAVTLLLVSLPIVLPHGDANVYSNPWNPLVVSVVTVVGIMAVVVSFALDSRRASGLTASTRSIQATWGLTFVAGWLHAGAQSRVSRMQLSSRPAYPEPSEIEQLLWEPLAVATLIVFLATFAVAVWFTFRDRTRP